MKSALPCSPAAAGAVASVSGASGLFPAAARTAVTAAGGGMYVQREVWLDRHEDTHRPEKILLFDPAGRVVMEAELGRYEKIAAAGEEADWPVMPTDIRITWPQAPSEAIHSIRRRSHSLVGRHESLR